MPVPPSIIMFWFYGYRDVDTFDRALSCAYLPVTFHLLLSAAWYSIPT